MSPEGWRHVTYGDVLRESDERAGERVDLPVLSVTKTRGLMLASERFGKAMHGRDLAKYRIARRNSIVADPMLLWDGSIGIQAVVEAGLVSPDYRVYEADAGSRTDFLSHLVRSPHMLPHYQGGARGTNVRRNRISRTDFLAIPLPHPTVSEQRRIAVILGAVDDAVRTVHAVVDELQVLRKTMISELLERGLPAGNEQSRAPRQPSASKEWLVCSLSDVAEVQTGIAKGKSIDSGVRLPYLRVANVQDGYLDLTEIKTILVDPRMVERYSLRAGDVLFTEGGDADKLGRGCVWTGQIVSCLHQNHVFAVRPDTTRLLPQYLALAAASRRGKAYFQESAKQTTNLASINSTQLKSFPVPLPSIPEQQTIVEAVGVVEARLAAEQAELQQLVAVKSALLTALLTGEIRVPPAPETP